MAQGYRVNAISRMLPITTTDRIPADERQKIDAAVPRQALAKPRQSRKLLIIDVCPAGGFYHTTIAHGNLMLQLIAKYTGAYEPIFDNNLDNLKYPRIKQYDAVFLNSVVGPVFSDPEVLDGLIRYVREGGGVAGLHGTTFASQDVREFGELMGAQEGPHQYNGEPGTLKIDDPGSPLTKHFGGKGFSMMDEFYHFPPTGPYTREKLHVLLSVDADKTDLAEVAAHSPGPRLRHGVDQDRRQGAGVQQRARAPAGVLHDAGPGEVDARRNPVRARRSRRRHDPEREAEALSQYVVNQYVVSGFSRTRR